jgi:PadR family transcriptional regulator
MVGFQGAEAGMGQFEFEVLTVVARLREKAYGVAIWDDLQEQHGRKVTIGALYTALGRLERKGFLSSRLGDPTPERGGRAKKFYRLEATGVTAMTQHRERAMTSLAARLEPELAKLDPVLEQLQLEVLWRESWPDAPSPSRGQRVKSPPGRGGRTHP